MRKYFSAFILATLLFAAPSFSTPTNSPIAVISSYEAVQQVAVTVRASGGSGSGIVVLGTNGSVFVWTAAHVIGESKADVALIKQIVHNGRAVGFWTVMAEVVSVNSTQDLAVLKPRSGYLFKAGTRFESENYIPKLGDPVVHCGSMQGLPGAESITTGVVSFAGRVMDGLIFDQTTATAMPGSSGGGVWSAEGKLIGIVVSGYSDTFSFIVPVRRMHEWAASEKHLEWLNK